MLLRDPLKQTKINPENSQNSGFFAILARAGVGKTALMVQIAINAMLKGKNVMHISRNDPVDKVDAWYNELFSRMIQEIEPGRKTGDLWDELLRHRFIMTFETESFSVPKLKKRIDELIRQKIFHPSFVMIDGFSFKDTSMEDIKALYEFVQKHCMMNWFTVRIHREKPDGDPDIISPELEPISNLFETMILLDPEKDKIHLKTIIDLHNKNVDYSGLYLDPSTMLIKKI